MYTLTGEKEFYNMIKAIYAKRGGQAKKLIKKRGKRTCFYKRLDRSANIKRKESNSVPAFSTSFFA
jgi:hypothetical protein